MSTVYIASSASRKIEHLALDSSLAPLAGLTDLGVLIRKVNPGQGDDGHYYDWSDGTFRAEGSVSDFYGTLTAVNATREPGQYAITWTAPASGTYVYRIVQETLTTCKNLPAVGEIEVGALATPVNVSTAESNIRGGSRTLQSLSIPGDTMALTAAAVDLIWDEVLTGATHNVATSAGRRLRELTAARLLLVGTASAGSLNTITLTGGVATDRVYRGNAVTITDGTGAGQTRTILDYVGSTTVATVGPPWKVAPDATSEFTVIAFATPAVVETGKVVNAASGTVTLHADSSTIDGTYVGMTVCILSGTGEGQSRRILSYDGDTKTATLASSWATVPDTTSAYVLLGSALTLSQTELGAVADAVWDEVEGTPTVGTMRWGAVAMRKWLKNRHSAAAGSSNNFILYDDDGTTPFLTYSLTDGSGGPILTPDGNPARRSAGA